MIAPICHYANPVSFRDTANDGAGGHPQGRPADGALPLQGRAHRDFGPLSVRPFRRLWTALGLSSLGDWLSIIALTALAPSLTGKGSSSIVAVSAAVSGVWLVSLLPALLFGPLAGAIADRLDRRTTMIVGDVLRAVLYLTIPLFPNLTWLYAAKFLAGVITMFWTPATNASIPNLVPKKHLERANQLSLITTYGTAPIAAGLFSVLALLSNALGTGVPFFHANKVDLALYINAASYGFSAFTVFLIRELPKRKASEPISVPSTLTSIWEGWQFMRRSAMVRGLMLGMVGSFCAAGVVVGLGYTYITYTLHGGDAGWGLVFAAVFLGLAAGMVPAARFLKGFSRKRLFGLAIVGAAISLAMISLVPNLIIVALFVTVLGATAGMAYATGFTLVGLEVDDDTRGRVFAFFGSAVQVILFAVIAISGFLASGVTKMIVSFTGSPNVRIGHLVYISAGQNVVLLVAAVVAVVLGVSAYRQMDDRKGVPLLADLMAAFRGELAPDYDDAYDGEVSAAHARGLFVAFEGGEGAGKSTQTSLLAAWLRDRGLDVVTTAEPGATEIGQRLRALLLDPAVDDMSPRAEALLYAADRAEHVATVVVPAIRRGAVVVTDRYVDSSLAYQGAGRGLPLAPVVEVNRWATDGLRPDLTVLLDVPPGAGLARLDRDPDRLEAARGGFHQRVRDGFRTLADREPRRYLVLDATRGVDELAAEIRARVADMLTEPAAEDWTEAAPALPIGAGPLLPATLDGSAPHDDQPVPDGESARGARDRRP